MAKASGAGSKRGLNIVTSLPDLFDASLVSGDLNDVWMISQGAGIHARHKAKGRLFMADVFVSLRILGVLGRWLGPCLQSRK